METTTGTLIAVSISRPQPAPSVEPQFCVVFAPLQSRLAIPPNQPCEVYTTPGSVKPEIKKV